MCEISDLNDQQQQEHRLDPNDTWFETFKSIAWHGGSAFDAWLNATSAQVLYGFMGCWTCYMITSLYADYRAAKEKENPKAFENHTIQWYEVLGGLLGPYWRAAGIFFNTVLLFCTATIQVIACGSTVYYIKDSLPKRTWTIIFGACCLVTVLIPSAHNYRVLSFSGILMTTYTAWYLTITAVIHGKDPDVTHSGAKNVVQYFTGATNILYAFGSTVTVEIMHAMWKPRKFKLVYLYAIVYIFTLTLPSAIAVYWRFGDKMLDNANAFAVFPKTKFRDAAVILMLMHQFIQFGLISLPIFIIWEKFVGVHHSKYYVLRAIARIPVVLATWFIAIMIPFFGPINSAVGSLLVTFSVYLIPCSAHMVANFKSTARKAAIEQPPTWILRSWTLVYLLNSFITVWVLIVGFGFGVYASVRNLVDQIDSFGLFARCYQCTRKY
ncbi:auxin transporter-like protein 1 isoform X2 [Selaginella moellendorffii]|uniref:auxin transporter-like protein 1 isoform X2 n=1 Tax=Selaginella moellendorffii TaxID=88036 RepID=UPI000D1C3AAA|nr:auxin transporter-like protein 1 isoform X2 [Selaginella moellendorffii]|eukprot:XP_024517893.1 auxin transporter-like protein 1 isoform X2 [Selaginella moellendorffii]